MALQLDKEQAQRITKWTESLPPAVLMSPRQLQAKAQQLAASSKWELIPIGLSRAGQQIFALHWTGVGPAVVAWGFPHPDEPSGALALWRLAEGLCDPGAPSFLRSSEWWLILCADPDQAQLNTDWIEQPSLDSYLSHHWRPLYQGLEVDYAFPINSPPFLQPRNWAPPEMVAPAPESVALADLLASVKPQLLGLMHSNHVSGAYSYINKRPSDSLIESWDDSTYQLGLAPHLGERPDPGKRWKTRRPDLLKEVLLAERLKAAEAHWGPIGQRSLSGCVSAAQYLESINKEAVVLTPEIGLWQPAEIGNLDLSSQTRKVRISFAKGKRGWRELWHGYLTLPGGQRKMVCYAVKAATGKKKTRWQEMPLGRGMVGVEVLEIRRWLMNEADLIWQKQDRSQWQDSPAWKERQNIEVPGSRVNDRSMLIFRTSSSYQRPITKAELTDLTLRWGMQSAIWIAHGHQLYLQQDCQQAAEQQHQLLQTAKQVFVADLSKSSSFFSINVYVIN